jgi:hypothetical protein
MSTKKVEDRAEYNRRAALVKRKARKLKRESWERFVSHLEHETHKLRPKTYKILRRMDTNFTERVRLPKVDVAEAMDYFVKHWSGENEELPQIEAEEIEEMFTIEDLNKVLLTMKNGKATGEDNIPAELYKYATPSFKKRLLKFYNLLGKENQIPDDFRKAIIATLFKKGDMTKMENYRGISLLCAGYNILARLLTSVINPIADTFLLESQNGFRSGCSCTDAAYTVKLLIEKRVEFNLETHLCFIDFEKAYDRVERGKLIEILLEQKIPKPIISLLRTLYSDTEICVRLENKASDYTKVNQGVRQGCPASCVLFNIYMDQILKEWYKTQPKGVKIEGTKRMETVLFADDQVIMAETEDELQRAVYNLAITAQRYNMKISTEKTRVMAFRGKDPVRSKIVINERIIEQVSSFKYLGSDISYLGEVDVNSKISKFLKVAGLINRVVTGNNVRRETRLRIYNTFAVPMLKYGCEVWALRKADKKRITAAEMRFMRRTAGYTLRDRKRNVDIMNELQTTPVISKIKTYRKKWREHVGRMDEERSPKQILQYTPVGRRSRGRPRKRLVDTSDSSSGASTPQQTGQ